MINVVTSPRGSIVYLVLQDEAKEMVVYSEYYNENTVIELLDINDIDGEIYKENRHHLLFATKEEANEYLQNPTNNMPYKVGDIVYRRVFANEECTKTEILSGEVLSIDKSGSQVHICESEQVGAFTRKRSRWYRMSQWSKTVELKRRK